MQNRHCWHLKARGMVHIRYYRCWEASYSDRHMQSRHCWRLDVRGICHIWHCCCLELNRHPDRHMRKSHCWVLDARDIDCMPPTGSHHRIERTTGVRACSWMRCHLYYGIYLWLLFELVPGCARLHMRPTILGHRLVSPPRQDTRQIHGRLRTFV